MSNNKKTTKSIAFILAAGLLASFMGGLGLMTTQAQQAVAQSLGSDERALVYWHSARCSTGATSCNNLKAITEGFIEGATNNLIFHYGPGQTPTQLQIDTMKATTGFTTAQKGMEGVSLAQLEQLAPIVQANFPGGWLGYNLEGHSPDSEEATPALSALAAEDIADAHGLRLLMAPSYAITNSGAADDVARPADIYHMQVQGLQDDDSTCDTLENKVINRVNFIRATYPTQIITYQVTLTQNPAPDGQGGFKTNLQTVQDCMLAASPTAVNGAAIWWGGLDVDDGDYGAAYTYHENTFDNG